MKIRFIIITIIIIIIIIMMMMMMMMMMMIIIIIGKDEQLVNYAFGLLSLLPAKGSKANA